MSLLSDVVRLFYIKFTSFFFFCITVKSIKWILTEWSFDLFWGWVGCCILFLSHSCLMYNGLTAEGFDGHGVMLIFWSNTGPQTDDEDVSEANDEGDDPDKHAQNDVCEQILKGWDSVCVWLAAPHVRRISTEFKTLKITEIIQHINDRKRE